MEALNAFSALKVFPKGTLLIEMYGATIGRLGILATEAATNQACCAMYGERRLCVQFAFYWLQAAKEFILLLASGGGQPNISQEKIRSLRVAAPPLPEQQAIAAFLDRETAKIDALVEKQRRMLDLLKEKRTALISHAVTKGLNPDAKLKDSGVAWLGMVPEGWEVKRLKEIFENLNFMRIPISSVDRADMEKNYPYYGASGIIDAVEEYIFDEILLLIAEDGANLLSRSTPLAFLASGKYWVNNHAHILRLHEGSIIYWEKMLQIFDYTPLISGSAQPKLTAERLGEIKLPLPPIPEQQAIAAFLARETAKIDTLAARIEDMIAKLQEYRTALITAAVTGKVNVQNM